MKIHCKYDSVVPTSDLKPYPKNRNKHPKEQIERLAKILTYQGIRAPIVVSKLSGFIVKGHGTLESIELELPATKDFAGKPAWDQAPVVYQDFENEEQEYAFVQSDNSIAAWAELDLAGINMDILDLGPFDIELLGLKDFVVEPLDKLEPGCDEDEVPEHVEPITKPGDLWILGNHRLLCGDASNPQEVEKLLGGEKAGLVFTDPPYGINVVGKDGNIGGGTAKAATTKFKQIIGDDAEFDANVCFGYTDKVVLFGGNYFAHTLPKAGRWMVWQKKLFDSDRTLSDCELVWTNLEGVMVKSYQHVWDGYFRSGTKKDELKSRIHPTQKPVALIEKMLNDLDETKVLDLFGGSGSTLIACEKTNRRCFTLELDAYYVDQIVSRWEKYTGKKAVLDGQA